MILLLFNAILYYTFLLLTNQLPINCNTFYSIIHHIYWYTKKKKPYTKHKKLRKRLLVPRIPTRLIVPFRYNVRFFFIAKIILNKKLKKYLSSYFVTFNVKKIRTKSRYSIFERIIDYFFFFFFFSIHRYSTARTKALKKYIINIKYPFFSFFFIPTTNF